MQISEPAPSGTGAVRLGPESGESVAGYLGRVEQVALPDESRLGLVQFDDQVDADTAAAALRAAHGVEPVQAVYRVGLPRVQTALRRLPVSVLGDPVGAVADAIRAGQTQAANQARAQARGAGEQAGSAPRGRPAAIAVVEADALAARCACVLAVVVRADPGAWAALRTAPAVRAVEIAGPEARAQALAVSPLLPEQREVVGPVPDDGPVPGR